MAIEKPNVKDKLKTIRRTIASLLAVAALTGCGASAEATKPSPEATTQVSPDVDQTPTPADSTDSETTASPTAEVETTYENTDSLTELPWGGPESGKYGSIEEYDFRNPETGEIMTLAEVNDYFSFKTEDYKSRPEYSPNVYAAQEKLVEQINLLCSAGTNPEELTDDSPTFEGLNGKLTGGKLGRNTAMVERAYVNWTGMPLSEIVKLEGNMILNDEYGGSVNSMIHLTALQHIQDPNYESVIHGAPPALGPDGWVYSDLKLLSNGPVETEYAILKVQWDTSEDGERMIIKSMVINFLQ